MRRIYKNKSKNCPFSDDFLEGFNSGTEVQFETDVKVLEEIKAEIKDEQDFAYADFERYKVECLDQDWDEVYDSLPMDDYRFGMIRALEIINKHIKEKT